MLPNAQESDPEQIFTFDRVFAPNSTQEEVRTGGGESVRGRNKYIYIL